MPELTPLDDNRQEHFLNGEDLEPITRREHFYAGRESELPAGHQEPETREEWFIQKYRGGGGDVTVVPLSVTENGTYSEEGKAYSPVSVNVPLPENAYLLKSVANLPQAIASFSDGAVAPMMGLKIAIEPVQSGSGDPSPQNIRPISGWTEANITIADDTTSPTETHTYTIDLDGTRYGGTLDVVSGVLTLDRAYKDLGSLNWTNRNSDSVGVFSSSEITDYNWSSSISFMCSNYKPNGTVISVSQMTNRENGSITFYFQGTSPTRQVYIKDVAKSSMTDEEFEQAMNGVQLVYELVTPITVQLTPTEIKTLLGMNNIWADTGDITDAEYFSKEV